MTIIDKILSDLIKGASQNGKEVELKQEGHEEKLAWIGLDDALGGVIGYNSGMNQAEAGEPYSFGGTQLASMLLPGGVGYQFGRGIGHSNVRTNQRKEKAESEADKKSNKTSALSAAFTKGAADAAAHFKVAFLGTLLNMGANAAGSTLAAKALGSRAAGIGGQMLTNLGGQLAQSGAEHLMAPRQQVPMSYLR